MDYRKLHEKRPYVYEIQNKYYCIGKAVFRKCTAEEIELYQLINRRTENLKEMYKEYFGKYWKNNVCDDFNKLLDLCDVECNDLEGNSCKRELQKFLCDYKHEDYEKINFQIEKFVELLNLSSEAEVDNLAKKGCKK